MSRPHAARRYRRKSEQLRLAREFRQSGLTQAAFSRQHQVSTSTLVRWLAKAPDVSPKPATPRKRVGPVVCHEVLPAAVSALPP